MQILSSSYPLKCKDAPAKRTNICRIHQLSILNSLSEVIDCSSDLSENYNKDQTRMCHQEKKRKEKSEGHVRGQLTSAAENLLFKRIAESSGVASHPHMLPANS